MADISLRLKLEDADSVKTGLETARDELVKLRDEKDKLSQSWKDGNKEVADTEKEMSRQVKATTKDIDAQKKAIDDYNKRVSANVAESAKALEEERKNRQSIVSEIEKTEKSIVDLERAWKKALPGAEPYDRFDPVLRGMKDRLSELNTELDVSDRKFQDLSNTTAQMTLGGSNFEELAIAIASSNSELETMQILYAEIEKIPQGERTKEMQDTMRGLSSAIDEVNRPEKLKNVRSQLRDVRNEMRQMYLDGKNNEDRYTQLALRAAELKIAIDDVAEAERGLGRHDRGVYSAISGVNELIAAFGIAQGAMNLFGADSDDMQKALVKLNAVMTILNGLTVIQTNLFRNDSLIKKTWTLITQTATWATNGLTVAQRALRVALLATGIGAVVVLLGLLAQRLLSSKDATDELASANDRAIDSSSKELASLQSLRAGIEDVNRTQEQRLASVEKLQKQYPALFGNLEKEKILAGQVADAWNLATKAIIAKATASVYEEDLTNQIKQTRDLKNEWESSFEAYEKASNKLNRLSGVQVGGLNDAQSNAAVRASRAERDATSATVEAFEKMQESRRLELEIANNIVKKQDEYNAILGVTDDSIKSIGGASSQFNNDITSFINRLQDISIENISDDYERDLAKVSLANERAIADLANEFQAIQSLGMATPEIVAQYQQAISDLADTQAKELIELSKKYEDERIALENEANNILLQIRGKNLQIELNELEESYNKRLEVLQKAGLEVNELIEQLENDQLAIIRKYDLEEIKAIEEGSLRKIKIIEKSSLNEAAKKEIINRITLEAQKKAINDSAALVESSVKITYDALMQYIEAFAHTGGSISIVDFFGEELSPEDIALLEKLIEKTAETIKEGASKQSVFDAFFSPEGFDIKGGLFALMATDNEQMNRALKSSLDQISQYSKDIFNSIYEAQRSSIEKEMNLIDERIAKLEESLNRQRQIVSEEQKLYEEGYANNYESEQKRLRNLEDVQNEELRAKEEAFEKIKAIEIEQAKVAWAASAAQQVADTAATASSLIRGAAQTTAAHSGIPFVGVALGLASAAALIAGFMSMRKQVDAIQSRSMGNFPSFGQGGGFALDGERSHANGGVNLMASDGRVLANYEGNEFLYAVKKSESKKDKYLPFLQAINEGNDDMIKNISLGFIGNEDLNKTTEKSINVSNVKFATQVDNAALRDIAYSNKEMLNLEKNKEFVTETNGMIIKKKGNTTFKIMKK